MRGMLAEAVQMDQSALAVPDAKIAFREALEAAGIPMNWIRSETTVKQMEEAQQAQEEAQQMLETMKIGSEVVANAGKAQVTM